MLCMHIDTQRWAYLGTIEQRSQSLGHHQVLPRSSRSPRSTMYKYKDRMKVTGSDRLRVIREIKCEGKVAVGGAILDSFAGPKVSEVLKHQSGLQKSH
jgi:hypothetical protein